MGMMMCVFLFVFGVFIVGIEIDMHVPQFRKFVYFI